jgi:hypothetical protein
MSAKHKRWLKGALVVVAVIAGYDYWTARHGSLTTGGR